MKMFFVSHGSSNYGAERSLAEIVGSAVRNGHEVSVFLPSSGPLESLLADRGLEPGRIRFAANHRWMGPELRGVSALRELAHVVRDTARFIGILRRERPDVVVVNSSVAPAAMFAGRMTRTPVVIFVRESILTNPWLSSPIPKRLIIIAIRGLSALVIANSQFVAKQIGFSTHVIYPPVDLRRTDPGPTTPAQSTLRLVALGRFTLDKGQLDLVKAVIRARRVGCDVEVDLYGDATEPAYAEAMMALIRQSDSPGAIRVHAYQSDIVPLLGAADLSVVTSPSEAFGRVTVESLQCGVPVLGYDAAGTSEILARGGGLLVAPNPQALGEAIRRVCSDRSLLESLKSDAAIAGLYWRGMRPEGEAVEIIEQVARGTRSSGRVSA